MYANLRDSKYCLFAHEHLCAACADSERSLGVYKVYYWLTLLLFLLMFIMAAWFVALVAVNTTGEL